jgi:hypothetical protein
MILAAESVGNPNGTTTGALFIVVYNSKTCSSQLYFYSVAGEPIYVATPFDAISRLQRFFPPAKKEPAKYGRPMADRLMT